MIDILKLVRPNILSLSPYSSARSEFSGIGALFLDANESPFGILNRYPDPYPPQRPRATNMGLTWGGGG